MRRALTSALGMRVVSQIAMHVVVDCASGEQYPEFLEPHCKTTLVAITPTNPNELQIDFRCRAPTTADVAAAIRSRL
ncbi:MAG: hypothetical protein ABI867_03305 [Kofleriaceae bacterium]